MRIVECVPESERRHPATNPPWALPAAAVRCYVLYGAARFQWCGSTCHRPSRGDAPPVVALGVAAGVVLARTTALVIWPQSRRMHLTTSVAVGVVGAALGSLRVLGM